MLDNVYCNNCEVNLLVKPGSNTCTNCGMEGCLSWREDEPQEIE